MFAWLSNLWHSGWGMAAAAMLAVLLLGALAPHDPMHAVSQPEQPPSLLFPFGTDMLGRDMLSRIMVGIQRTALSAIAATLLALAIGISLGAVALAFGGFVDIGMLASLNAWLAIPPLILALALIAITGSGFLQIAVATGLAFCAPVAFVVRAGALEVRSRLFVMAGRASGASTVRIWRAHILPNLSPLIASYGIVIFSYSILGNAALQFLGLGGEPGAPDLGAMMSEGRFYMRAAPWSVIAPGVALTLIILIANTIARRVGRGAH